MPTKTKKLLFGTQNKAKSDHMCAVLSNLPVQITTPHDLNISLNVPETGSTPTENAELKAQAYFQASKVPTFSIDVGLHIDKFSPDKQPGVYVRRIQGTEKDDDEMITYYTEELQKVGGTSTAMWHMGIALVTKDRIASSDYQRPTTLTAQASTARIPGAPLSALQIDPQTGKYLSELTWEERAALQMKGDAEVRAFIQTHFLPTS